mmetsp:Transcript_19802/g.68784  ORF Transcript_19802/g.68784 Transcript_19802/m.68784 type:complete len:253 (+) Transcript_19802:500-1258(+)
MPTTVRLCDIFLQRGPFRNKDGNLLPNLITLRQIDLEPGVLKNKSNLTVLTQALGHDDPGRPSQLAIFKHLQKGLLPWHALLTWPRVARVVEGRFVSRRRRLRGRRQSGRREGLLPVDGDVALLFYKARAGHADEAIHWADEFGTIPDATCIVLEIMDHGLVNIFALAPHCRNFLQGGCQQCHGWRCVNVNLGLRIAEFCLSSAGRFLLQGRQCRGQLSHCWLILIVLFCHLCDLCFRFARQLCQIRSLNLL